MAETAGNGILLDRYKPWLYAAALYNLAWGLIIVFFPGFLFDFLSIDQPNYLPLWQVIAMFVLVYAPAYWWAGRAPANHRHLVFVGLLGKVLGPLGFLWAVVADDFPARFGLTIVTNDLIWLPAFALYLRDAARLSGGWVLFLRGE